MLAGKSADTWPMKRLFFVAALSTLPLTAHARSTNLCFSEGEVLQMRRSAKVLAQTASKCLDNYWKTHEAFFDAQGYSKYFGNRNDGLQTEDQRRRSILLALWPDMMKKFRPEEQAKIKATKGLKEMEALLSTMNPSFAPELKAKKTELKVHDRAKDELDLLMEADQPLKLLPNASMTLQNISCVDMARRCLSSGFEAAKMESTWKKIDSLVKANGVSGVMLQKALADLGWNTIYFNPDPSQNKAWDDEDRLIAPLKPKEPGGPMPKWNPIWGAHAERWDLGCLPDGSLRNGLRRGGVRCSDHYELGAESPVPVDDKRTLVGFGTRVPEEFKKVPFFVGTAHAGYHVFPGSYGGIIEAHSKRRITSKDNLERSAFNPLDQEQGGGPRWTDIEKYRSGMIVVPPGFMGLPLLPVRSGGGGCVDLRPRSPR